MHFSIYDFSQVTVAVIESQLHTARLFRDVLGRLGIKNVETFTSAQDAAEFCSVTTPDLVIADMDGDNAGTLELLRSLRNDPKVQNPFACLVATTWSPTQLLVVKVTNAGVDDLLVKPVSPNMVRDRLAVLIEARKRFVVTADYTGPDRRKTLRDSVAVPQLEAPNTLRLKAINRWSNINQHDLMQEGLQFIADQKRVRISIQVAFLIEFALPALDDPANISQQATQQALEHLSRIPALLEELQKRVQSGPGSNRSHPGSDQGGIQFSRLAVDDAVRPLRHAVGDLLDAAKGGGLAPLPTAGWVEAVAQLRHHASTLLAACDPPRPVGEAEREVETAVAGYRAKLDRLARERIGSGGVAS